MKAVFNFTMVEMDNLSEYLDNRAFRYGDGLFETIIVQNKRIPFLKDHYERLLNGMKILQMNVPADFSLDYLQREIMQLCKLVGLSDDARLRLQIWRKPGGLYTPESNDIDFLLTAFPFIRPHVSIKNRLIFYEDIRLHHSILSPYKTSSALPYVMAGIARKSAGVDDVILMDVYGHIAECVASNIFWIKENVLYTPSLESGCIAGIIRKAILREAALMFSEVKEDLFHKEVLFTADTIFTCNVAGIQLVKEINGVSFHTDTPLTDWFVGLLSGNR
ncbi:aminotransferase class IV [Cytophagaceae bacterium YF14B1]|uniref:branched-chain-amino-acid transaminase n=1 Tax=Xanthocytophaga flava TaxID=3048013 RepID=A0AAE3U6X8_9BACT|nr:aminotransferase class IV [Xanthocytophaga flavus]MDJ1482339.1 aminotransferase class IV [Xanthocytophaga flavus]